MPSLGAQNGATPPDMQQFKLRQDAAEKGAGRSSFINSVGMRMVLIRAGTFMMGSPEGELGRRDNLETQHEVTISRPFYMGAMLVTRDQYEQLMKLQGEDAPVPGNTPVNYVSWFDATRYCELLSEREHRHYHLPTEAQWEYACRAGTTGMFGGTGRIDDMGWFGKDWPTPPIGGQKQPNAWRIYDMHGNLKQWCLDYFRNYSQTPEIDPIGEGGKLKLFTMLRGGDYHLDLAECRSAARAWTEPKDRNRWIGFRVVMDIPEHFPQPNTKP